MEAEKKEENHFDPYVRLEVLESERRLEKQIHELEIKMLNGFNDIKTEFKSSLTEFKGSLKWYIGGLYGIIGLGFTILTWLQAWK